MKQYRGKRIDNGEWVYGNLIYSEGAIDRFECLIVPIKDAGLYHKTFTEDIGLEIWHRVDPSTVGQEMWKKCAAGNTHFEGDKVEYQATDGDENFESIIRTYTETITLDNFYHLSFQHLQKTGTIHDKESN